MTINQFNNLKIGEIVYIPDVNKKGKLFSTEVLQVDKFFGKITVLLGGKPLSYRYVKIKANREISFYCGTTTYVPTW